MIVNEGQSPIQFGYLNTLYHDGTIVEHPVTFAMIEALPDVPGSIAR